MKNVNYEIGPYNIHLIKTDRFKVNRVAVLFKRPVVKEEITMRNLLCDILTSTTKKYHTERLMNIKTEELYGMIYGASSYLSGNYAVMDFSMEFLNDKYTPESILEPSLEFLMNILFNPNIKNKQFDQKTFDINKKNLEINIESEKDNPRKYSITRMLKELGKDTSLEYNSNGYLEDLKEITNESLYQYYLTVLKKDIVDIFVLGDIDFDKIKNLITNKMQINTIKKKPSSHYIVHTDIKRRSKEVIEQKDINQSKLVIGCKLKDLSPFELGYVSNIYSYILGGSPDSLLFKNVREKNSLCYYISSSVNKVRNLLIIESGINKKDYKKTVKLIKKELKNIGLGKFDDKYIENGKLTYLNACEELCDNPKDLLNMYITCEYLQTDSLEVKEKEIAKVTKDDVMAFSHKVHLDTIFLLEGGEDEESSN